MVNSIKELVDFFTEFKELYFKILADFNFDYNKDCEARNLLSEILIKKADDWNLENVLLSFKKLIQENSRILIYGCDPTLEETVESILRNKGIDFFKKFLNLAADGASLLLNEKGIPINVIFSDLDGITKNEFSHPDFMVIHAHGDNLEKLKYFEHEIINYRNIIGTTQVEPLEYIISPGGFTDGDRILYLLRPFLLPNHRIFLIGMDFSNIIGRYSKPTMKKHQEASPMKRKKLNYALKLTEWLKNRIKNEIYFINSESISKKFKYLTLEEFENC